MSTRQQKRQQHLERASASGNLEGGTEMKKVRFQQGSGLVVVNHNTETCSARHYQPVVICPEVTKH
jgi:hypothetical protein